MPVKKMDYAERARDFVGRHDVDVARILGISNTTVGRWRKKLDIEHPRQALRDRLAPWLGRIPDRILAKIAGISKTAVCQRRKRAGIDSSRFENWRDKSWIDELLGHDSDERVAALCEVDVDFVRDRREALSIEPHRRRFMIATKPLSSRGSFPPAKEYELVSVTRNGLYVFRIVATGATETFTVWQLRDARVEETTRRLWS